MSDIPSSVFERIWPGGFIETWEAYDRNYSEDVCRLGIDPFSGPSKVAVEIGCGLGYWTTKFLSPRFSKVFALDVVDRIPKSTNAAGLPVRDNITFYRVPDRNFDCHGVSDSSVDFVFSFGCFCHLSEEANAQYLRGIRRVLKPGGCATIMFANWKRHPCLNGVRPTSYNTSVGCWFYNDHELTAEMVHDAGLTNFTELIPNFRDTLGHFVKPPIAQ